MQTAQEEQPTVNLLKNIDSPDDLKKLSPEQLPQVCNELRQMIIDQGFCSELVASDLDVLIFVLACASKACEFSRHK